MRVNAELHNRTKNVRTRYRRGLGAMVERLHWRTVLAAGASLALITAGLVAVRDEVGIVNVAMVYLLCVLVASLRVDRVPAILAAIAAFLLFNVFFLPPYYTITIANSEHVIALAVFLIVALVISNLVANAQERASVAEQEQARANLLFQLNEGLVADRSLDDILTTIVRHVVEIYGAAHAAILTREGGDRLTVVASYPDDPAPLSRDETTVALRSLTTGTTTGLATGRAKVMAPHGLGRSIVQRLPKEDVLYLPIDTPTRQIGVLQVRGRPLGGRFDQSDRELLGSLADQAALALERVRLTSEAGRAEVLAQSDELKSALLASVSHDLRTPLATIKTSVSALQDDTVDWPPQARTDFLKAIDEETDRLTRMVANLLDLSRIEGGALQPDRDWYDARELVQQVIGRLSPRAEATSHRLSAYVAADVTLGFFDYVEIDQVLANLVENALKYTPSGSSIDVEAEVTPEGLRFAVRDNGPGIPPHARDRVFDKFYRAGNAQGLQGTGIGLTISRGLVEAHGGQIRIESASGSGTSVFFTIPFDRSSLREYDPA